MKYLSYLFFRITVILIGILPFKTLYKLADFIAFFFEKILRYRYKVIKENLALTNAEFNISKEKIITETYRNLADITLESIKGFTMSDKELKERHRWINPEILDKTYKESKSVILVSGHFNNWEWGAFSPNYFLKHTVIGLYKPLTNKYINQYMLKERATSGTVLADINQTKNYFEEYADKTSIFLMAADQSPTKPKLAIWTEFLGVETPCLHGVEKYKEEYELPIIFVDIQRVKRGYYTLELKWIDEEYSSCAIHGASTIKFMQELEKRIKENPGSWLWSHRRWKHKRK